MQTSLSVLGIELVVDDLDRAVELFTTVLGCALLSRGPAALVAGELAVIDAGAMVISLLEPAASGPGPLLGHREPRLTQIVMSSPSSGHTAEVMTRSIEAGLSVVPGSTGFHLDPDALEGALGQMVAVVVTTMEIDSDQ